MTQPTKLGNAVAGKTAASSRFQTAIANGRVAVPYTIPGINLPCLMTIVGTEKLLDLDGEANRRMAQRGFAPDYIVQDKYELQKAAYVLAEACRDDDPKLQPNPPPIGTRADWGALSPEIIAAAWVRFNDLRTQYDPLADDVQITTTEFLEYKEAIAKKNTAVLRAFGLPKLIACLLTSESLPASLLTPKSEDGLTSPESSPTETTTQAEQAPDAT